jgi:hypothetical protein
MELLPNVGPFIEEMLEPFLEPNDLGLFWWVTDLLRKRSEAVDRRLRSRQPVVPSEYDGSPAEIVEAYLADTPFEAIFRVGIPFDIPLEDRGEHTAIVAGSGCGKTQLLQSIIADDLQAYEGPPGLVVIDSTERLRPGARSPLGRISAVGAEASRVLKSAESACYAAE